MKKRFFLFFIFVVLFANVFVAFADEADQDTKITQATNGVVNLSQRTGKVENAVVNLSQRMAKQEAKPAPQPGITTQSVKDILTNNKDRSTSLKLLRKDMESTDAGATVRMFTTEVALLDAAGYSKDERVVFDGIDPVKDAVARRAFLAKAYQRLVRNITIEMLTNPDADINKEVAQLFSQRVDEIVPKPEKQDLSGYAKTTDIPKPVDLSGYAKTTDIPKPVDLSGYAKTSDIPKPVDLSGYAKTSDLEDYASQGDLDHVAGQAKQAKDAATVLAIGGHFGADKEAARIILGLSEEDAKKIAKKAKELGLK